MSLARTSEGGCRFWKCRDCRISGPDFSMCDSMCTLYACTHLQSIQSSESFVDLYSPSPCTSWRDMNIFDDLKARKVSLVNFQGWSKRIIFNESKIIYHFFDLRTTYMSHACVTHWDCKAGTACSCASNSSIPFTSLQCPQHPHDPSETRNIAKPCLLPQLETEAWDPGILTDLLYRLMLSQMDMFNIEHNVCTYQTIKLIINIQ